MTTIEVIKQRCAGAVGGMVTFDAAWLLKAIAELEQDKLRLYAMCQRQQREIEARIDPTNAHARRDVQGL